MTADTIRTEIDGCIGRVVLSRAQKRNALSRAMLNELLAAVRALAGNSAIRLVELAAVGPVFCAGMDLDEMQQTAASPTAAADWQSDARLYRQLLGEILSLAVPTLAIVQGPAVAGGLGIILACDLVLACDAATFALPEPKRGIAAAVIAPLLVYRVGLSRASYLLLSGRSWSAAEAREAGICHEVASTTELSRRQADLEKSILSGAPGALATTKEQIRAVAASELAGLLDAAAEASAAARATPEAREGLAAFLEKRKPDWTV